MSQEDEFALTDLSERLRSRDGGQVAEQALQRLTILGGAVDERLATGVSPDEYRRLRRQSDALAAAQRIMIKLIERSQPPEPDGAGKSREERRG